MNSSTLSTTNKKLPRWLLALMPTHKTAPASQVRVGTDIVWIPSVQDSVSQFGERYLRRIFTPQELLHCQRIDSRPLFERLRFDRLAARFAAKEAVMKLLRPDAHTTIPWTTIEVINQVEGAPAVHLSGTAATRAHFTGLQHISLSLSHDNDYAIATAMAVTSI